MKPITYKKVTPRITERHSSSEEADVETGPAVEKEKKPAVKEKATPAAPAQRGLRQIAQDIWKKYGQSAGAKEVDGWRLPPIDILDDIAEKEIGQADNTLRAGKIEEALRSYGVVG